MVTTATTALTPGNTAPAPNQHPQAVLLLASRVRIRRQRRYGTGPPIEADFSGTDCQQSTFRGHGGPHEGDDGRHDGDRSATRRFGSSGPSSCPTTGVAILLKSHDTGGTAQRVGPVSLIAVPSSRRGCEAENARRFQRVRQRQRHSSRSARRAPAKTIGEIGGVFLICGPRRASRCWRRSPRATDPPPPNCVITSPNRVHPVAGDGG